MKKHLILLFVSLAAFNLFGQQSYVKEANISYYTSSEGTADVYKNKMCLLDIIYPKNAKNYATVVWFHGGGLSGGVKEDIPAELLNKGFAIVSVGYRLSPAAKCPEYIEDAAAATAWVFNNIAKYGGSTSKVFLSGHSAGGYLDLMVGLDKKWLAKYGIDAGKLAAIIPLSAQTITHFTIRKERGIPDKQPIVDEYAPLYFVRADTPPIYLITGDREMELLGRYEENAYFFRMLKVAGNPNVTLKEVQGFDHGGMVTPGAILLVKAATQIAKSIP